MNSHLFSPVQVEQRFSGIDCNHVPFSCGQFKHLVASAAPQNLKVDRHVGAAVMVPLAGAVLVAVPFRFERDEDDSEIGVCVDEVMLCDSTDD